MAHTRTLDARELSLPPLTTIDDATVAPAHELTVDAGATLAALTPRWEALAAATHAPPFLWPRWFAAWERAFAPGAIEAVAVRHGDSLVGVMPLLPRRRTVYAAANDHTPRFGAVVASAAAAGVLADHLLARNRPLRLAGIEERSALVGALADRADAAGHSLTTHACGRQPYVDLDGSWAEFEAALPRNTRREGARLRRRIDEAGAVTFEYGTDVDLLDEGFTIEGSGWKSERGTAIASCQATDSFYRAIAEWAAERGWLRLAFLRVDGRPAAFDLCIEAHDTIYVLKGGFDPAFRKYGPGRLLIRETLINAFARGLRRYEFLGADDPYKLAWTETAHALLSVRSYPPTARGRARALLDRGRAAGR
jgi:CelD/BcsL family acetyltransferase involved in cellulose biosynthesis